MKKLAIAMVTMLCFSTASLMAQTSSTGTQGGEWTKIESSQVPASVRQTLKADRYKGWENAEIFYDKSAKQYSVDLKNGGASHPYLFDANGKAIVEKNANTDEDKSMGSTIPGKDPGTPPDINPPASTTPKP